MFWQVDSYPQCTHHVFLSHCREDYDDLVRPVYDALKSEGVVAWLDREDYPYGRDSRTALQDSVLRSRHVVFFVTPAMLSTGRGWCVFELAYAEIIQANLHYAGGPLANLFLPLFFVPQSDPSLPRTVWQATRDRGRFDGSDADHPTPTADRVTWAVQEIVRYLREEERLARETARRARKDKEFQQSLAKPIGRFRRVTKFDPVPLAQQPT